MHATLPRTAVLALAVANAACATQTAEPVFDPDPALHAPGGRIVFNRMCADEDPYRVKAYARMESPDGRARAVAAVLAGYRATGGRTVYIDVRIQRLRLDAGTEWRNSDFTIGLRGHSSRRTLEGPTVGGYHGGVQGQEPSYRRFRADEAGSESGARTASPIAAICAASSRTWAAPAPDAAG